MLVGAPNLWCVCKSGREYLVAEILSRTLAIYAQNSVKTRVSLFDGMERWNGTVEWNDGMEWNGMEWNGMTTPTERAMTTYTHYVCYLQPRTSKLVSQ